MGTLVSWIALLVGAVALVYAWRLQQELNRATRRLDRYNRALFDANDEIRRLREEAVATAAQLRVEWKQRTGDITFQPEMTVREAQLLHPQTQQILAGFHLGGCSNCAIEPDDTLAKVCNENGLDPSVLIRNLNLLIGSSVDHTHRAAQSVKLPNIELNL